jgi:hypothetical protein
MEAGATVGGADDTVADAWSCTELPVVFNNESIDAKLEIISAKEKIWTGGLGTPIPRLVSCTAYFLGNEERLLRTQS